MSWVRIRSWHRIDRWGGGFAITRCGRTVDIAQNTAEDLPLDEPSCETCLRLTAHDREQA